jgi:hypothetical protein
MYPYGSGVYWLGLDTSPPAFEDAAFVVMDPSDSDYGGRKTGPQPFPHSFHYENDADDVDDL